MVVQREEVAAIRAEAGIICAGCMTEADWEAVTAERIVTQKEKTEENLILFCDRCGDPV